MNPETYTHGLSEIVRAARAYTGIGQRGMAEKLSMNRRDYQRIESGRDACPPGLLDSLDAVLGKFDDDVAKLTAAAEENGGLELTVEEWQDWERAVAGRAAVLVDGWRISLTLVG